MHDPLRRYNSDQKLESGNQIILQPDLLILHLSQIHYLQSQEIGTKLIYNIHQGKMARNYYRFHKFQPLDQFHIPIVAVHQILKNINF